MECLLEAHHNDINGPERTQLACSDDSDRRKFDLSLLFFLVNACNTAQKFTAHWYLSRAAVMSKIRSDDKLLPF